VPTEAIVCPTCRAADTSRPDPHGVHTCVYCGARYRLTAHVPVAVKAQAAAAPTKKKNLAILAGLIVLLAAAIGARFALRVSAREPARIRSVQRDPAAPSVRNPIAIATPAPDAPPEAPAAATFEFHSRASAYQTSYYVLGWVTNTSAVAIDRPKVVAVLLDAAGKEVGTAQGFPAPNDLGPGDRVPIKILVNKPPPHAELRYEVSVRKASYRSPRVAGLRVEPVTPTRAAFGSSWDVNGKVFHEGKEPAKFVRVTILALDKDGRLIGLNEGFAQGATEILQPGQSARFNVLSAFADTTPARFEFQVEAMAVKN
jgi:hypothetical protein